MTAEELLSNSKKKIRNNQELADLFTMYFNKYFRKDPKFCCTFSDYEKLKAIIFKPQKQNKMSLKKYEVNYPSKKILKFKGHNNIINRRYAKDVDDDFIESFLKLHNPERYPKIEKKIKKIEGIPKQKTVAELKEIISQSGVDDLAQYSDDPRIGVQKSVEDRLNDLKHGTSY